MNESGTISFPVESEITFYLVSDEEAVDETTTSLEERIDDQLGVQARVPLSDCTTREAYDSILKATKVGSRWGKDLEDVYRDAVDSFLTKTGGPSVADRVREWYDEYGADAHEASLTGDALNIGIGVEDTIRETFDDWTELTFDENDLTAAIGIARSGDSSEWECAGYVILESRKSLSLLRDRNSVGQLVQVVQQLRLLDLEIAIVAPKDRTNERDIVEDVFHSIGGFDVVDKTGTAIDVTDEVKAFVDEWYDRLCYDVHDKNVSERTAQLASVTAYDLSKEEKARHFVRAIRDGLQHKYSERKFNRDRFETLWEERIIPHKQYDPSRSRRADFPTVEVTRSDRVSRVFELHHEGPRARPHMNGIPIESDEPESELVELIERFLDAEIISEDRWQELVETVQTEFEDQASVAPEALVNDILLRRTRKRAELVPLISRFDSDDTIPTDEHGKEWYDKHWSTILSRYRVTTQIGINAIKRKQQLMQSLSGTSVADSVLYYKLKKDIENAWQAYLDDIESGVAQNFPAEFNFEIAQEEISTGKQITFTVATPDEERLSTTVDIYFPYAEVYVNDQRVQKATASRTVAAVVDTFESVLYQRTTGDAELEPNPADLLYSIIEFYVDITECEPGDLVYFDDLINFCRYLPRVWDRFKRPTESTEESLRTAFGDERLIKRLRDKDTRFHRKGSDNHGSIETAQNRYVAFEVVDSLI